MKPADATQPDLPVIKCNPVRGAAVQKIAGPLSSGGKHLIACEYPQGIGPITQCEAASACSPPWKLCTLNAYVSAIPGGGTPTALEWGWLAACVRRNGAVLWDPTAICDSGCDLGSSPLQTVPLMKDCTNLPYPSSSPGASDAGCPPTCVVADNVGLTSYTLNWCWRSPNGATSGPFAPCPVNGKGSVGGNGKTQYDPRRALCCYP